MGDFAVEVKNLSYRFKEDLVLKEISFNLESNKIYGLLGKNGAGKTTLLNLLVKGLLAKEGEIKLFGNSLKDTDEVLEQVCIMREGEFYNKEMKIKDIMRLYASFYKDYDKALEEKMAAQFNVPPKKAYGKCSRGMRSLVFNIIALCSNAPLTILDEPTLGLDAEIRETFYDMLLEAYSEKPRTMIISTHLIEEIENLLEEVLILHKGELLLQGNVEELKSKSCYLTGREESLQKAFIELTREEVQEDA